MYIYKCIYINVYTYIHIYIYIIYTYNIYIYWPIIYIYPSYNIYIYRMTTAKSHFVCRNTAENACIAASKCRSQRVTLLRDTKLMSRDRISQLATKTLIQLEFHHIALHSLHVCDITISAYDKFL